MSETDTCLRRSCETCELADRLEIAEGHLAALRAMVEEQIAFEPRLMTSLNNHEALRAQCLWNLQIAIKKATDQ